MFRFMVSYQYKWGPCGNQTFDNQDDVNPYIEANKHNWKSYTKYKYTPDDSGLSVLTLIPKSSENHQS